MNSLWLILIQALVSTAPGIIFTASLPLLCEKLGYTASHIGFVYSAFRVGFLLSTLSCPFLVKRLSNRGLALSCEILNVVMQSLLFLAISIAGAIPLPLLMTFLFFRGFGGGNLVLSRFSWIRRLDGGISGSRILVIVGVSAQVAYGAAGFAILKGLITPGTVRLLIIFDILTSILGFFVFLFSRDVADGDTQMQTTIYPIKKFIKHKWLLASDLLLAAGIGGTNLFLVKLGNNLFKGEGGYGAVLLTYAVFYGMGGMFVVTHLVKKVDSKHIGAFVILLLAIGMCALPQLGNSAIAFGIIALVFVTYSISYSLIELSWFKISTHETAASFASVRQLSIGLTAAASEAAFTFPGDDSLIRAAFLGFAFLCYFRYQSKTPKTL